MTRAVVGEFLLTTHLAKVRGESNGKSLCPAPDSFVVERGGRNAGTPAVTGGSGLSQSPRLRMRVSRTSWRASSVRAVEPVGHSFHNASIFWLASLNSATV